MIEVESYTCAECGGPVSVVGIVDPIISRACGHNQAIVHANLRGTMFGESAMQHVLLTLDQIPAGHRAAFEGPLLSQSWVRDDGTRVWPYKVWTDYIEAYHALERKVDEERRARAQEHRA